MSMPDEDVFLYLNIKNVEVPAPKNELRFLKKNNVESELFSKTYLPFTARIAKSFYDRHSHANFTLGQAIETANTGLIMASFSYIRLNDNTLNFKSYARNVINKELNSLVKT